MIEIDERHLLFFNLLDPTASISSMKIMAEVLTSFLTFLNRSLSYHTYYNYDTHSLTSLSWPLTPQTSPQTQILRHSRREHSLLHSHTSPARSSLFQSSSNQPNQPKNLMEHPLTSSRRSCQEHSRGQLGSHLLELLGVFEIFHDLFDLLHSLVTPLSTISTITTNK